jgi:hypothetical protein
VICGSTGLPSLPLRIAYRSPRLRLPRVRLGRASQGLRSKWKPTELADRAEPRSRKCESNAKATRVRRWVINTKLTAAAADNLWRSGCSKYGQAVFDRAVRRHAIPECHGTLHVRTEPYTSEAISGRSVKSPYEPGRRRLTGAYAGRDDPRRAVGDNAG